MDDPLYLGGVITLSGSVELDLHLHLIQAGTEGIKLGFNLHDSEHKSSHCVDIARYFSHLEDAGHLAVQEPYDEAIPGVEDDHFEKIYLVVKHHYGTACEVTVEAWCGWRYCVQINPSLGGGELDGITLEPVYVISIDLIGVTEVFSSHGRVVYGFFSVNA